MDASYYEELAESDPSRLAQLVEGGRGTLGSVEWLMVCEIAGQKLPTAKIQGPLVRRIQKATNAEEFNAIMSGLSYHLDSTGLTVMQRLADKSANPAIRACAIETMDQDQYNSEPEDGEPDEDSILFD